jgi:two-component system, cell cycle response regulator DivK
VLIVDDDDRNLKLARDVLLADGVRTLEATTGAEALDRASRDRPDVILLDLRLPDMSGFDVLRELASREATAEIPVVALTALRTDGDSEWLFESGFSGYLEKPISVQDFPKQVREHWRNAAP